MRVLFQGELEELLAPIDAAFQAFLVTGKDQSGKESVDWIAAFINKLRHPGHFQQL